MRPRFISSFTVIAKKFLDYALNLPRKMLTYLVFYVGLIKPYHDSSLVDREILAAGRRTNPQKDKSSPKALPDLPTETGCTPPSKVICRPS